MPSPRLKIVVNMLRSAPAVAGAHALAMRKSMEAVVAAVLRPEGVACAPLEANGVPGEWTVAGGARDGVAIVYFHGGRYVMGSLNTHRGHCARMSQAARVRVLSWTTASTPSSARSTRSRRPSRTRSDPQGEPCAIEASQT